MTRFKYKIIVAYDGTGYGGWQVQKNAISVQSLIQDCLKVILRAPISIHGSGRTDAGVHALAQVSHFATNVPINIPKVLASLNSCLPPDIRILSLESAPLDFHARFSAVSKIYHYRLHLGHTPDPFKRLYAYHVLHPVDIALLKEAAKHFIGTHDFSSFANEAGARARKSLPFWLRQSPGVEISASGSIFENIGPTCGNSTAGAFTQPEWQRFSCSGTGHGSASKDAVRTLYRLDVIEEPGGVRLEFEGNGFLYKMVRNIVGTLLDVCAGKIAKDQIPKILAAKDRKQAGKAAPPHGLYLIEVKYEKESKCPAPSLLASSTCP